MVYIPVGILELPFLILELDPFHSLPLDFEHHLRQGCAWGCVRYNTFLLRGPRVRDLFWNIRARSDVSEDARRTAESEIMNINSTIGQFIDERELL